MWQLFLINLIIIAIIVGVLFLIHKYVKKEKTKEILLMVSPLLTILCHYSSLVYHLFSDGSVYKFLSSNPNLILPIYPCNIVMWCLLIFGFLKMRKNKFGDFLADFCFLFGIVSALVGMFANIDFIREPSLANYDVTKGIVAHGFMLFNLLLIPFFGYIKIDTPKNIKNIFIGTIIMFCVGAFCNLVFHVVGSEEAAYEVNSMFLLKSPFEGLDFLNYYVIVPVAIVLYFGALTLYETIFYKKGSRWYDDPEKLKRNI